MYWITNFLSDVMWQPKEFVINLARKALPPGSSDERVTVYVDGIAISRKRVKDRKETRIRKTGVTIDGNRERPLMFSPVQL